MPESRTAKGQKKATEAAFDWYFLKKLSQSSKF